MPTEGLSKENRALVERLEGRLAISPQTADYLAEHWGQANMLLNAARAEGPAPPGGGGEEDYRGSLRSAPGSTSNRTDGTVVNSREQG